MEYEGHETNKGEQNSTAEVEKDRQAQIEWKEKSGEEVSCESEPVASAVENLISIPSIQQLYRSLIFDKG